MKGRTREGRYKSKRREEERGRKFGKVGRKGKAKERKGRGGMEWSEAKE
jgi:hypothetical protein